MKSLINNIYLYLVDWNEIIQSQIGNTDYLIIIYKNVAIDELAPICYIINVDPPILSPCNDKIIYI